MVDCQKQGPGMKRASLSRLEIGSLSVILGDRTVLTDLSLTVNGGEFVAVVGPNGSGKSTLLRTIAGDLVPTHGSVQIDGVNPATVDAATAAAIRSYLPQAHVTDIGFDVATVVGFGAYTSDGIEEPRERVRASMHRVGVTDLADRPFRELSGGEQRRVTIARVLCQDAPVVLLDEPTDSLDLGHADRVMSVAADEASIGRIVVSTSHDLNVAGRHASSMVLMHNGRIIKSGTPSEVLDADLLSDVYETTVTILLHPTTGTPVVCHN